MTVPAELGTLALRAAAAGRAAIRRVRASPDWDVRAKQGLFDLVTAADGAAEAAVIGTIRTARPDDEILAEETGAHTGTSGVRWVVDPLDGTTNFVHGRPDHVLSVGVEVDGRPRAGAILRPVDGHWAMTDGSGVWCGDEAAVDRPDRWLTLPAPAPVEAAAALVVVAHPVSRPGTRETFALMGALVPAVAALRMSGSAASDLLDVAVGRADAFVGCGLAPWDVAAGRALAETAGRRVLELSTPPFPVLVVAVEPLAVVLADLVSRTLRDRPIADSSFGVSSRH